MQKHDAAWVLKILDTVMHDKHHFQLAGLPFVLNLSVQCLG